jgi:HK97 gp10 family phage protein
MIKVSLRGIKGLEKALKGKSEALTKAVDMEIKASVIEINQQQKTLAPVDFGALRSSLKWAKTAPMTFEIVSSGAGSSYAPYQEFGTGGLVDVPAGLEDVAIQYKGKGSRQINMRPQPFFFAPAFAEWNKLKKRIENMLKK